jgi:hypothetical protein
VNCPHCGTSNFDNASICANCGRSLAEAPAPPRTDSYTPPPPPPRPAYSPAGPPPGAPIPNYLVQSILVTLCCCLPLGVVAIIFAAQVNSKLAAGDVAGAQEASNKARMFCWLAFGLGLVALVLGMLINGAAFYSAIQDAAANR